MNRKNLSFDSDSIYNQLLQQKAEAIKAVYSRWAKVLVHALKREAPYDRGQISKAIGYKIEPDLRRGNMKPGETIKMVVGVLAPKSKALKYLRFVTKRVRSHFVPIKSNNRYTGILGWAQRHKLVKQEKGRWVWATGDLKGKPFSGVKVNPTPNDFFEKVYLKYNAKIEADLRRVMEEKIT